MLDRFETSVACSVPQGEWNRWNTRNKMGGLQHRPLEKCGQIVVKFGEYKKSDLVKCLKINNLQGLICASGGNTNFSAEITDNQ